MNLGGWWALLTIKQREAQQQAEWRAFQADMAAERRHRELLASMASIDDEEGLVPDRPYTGPTVGVDSLKLLDFGAITLPEDEGGLREALNPPNLLVVGGEMDAGWAAAVALQDVLGGRLEVFDLALAPDPVRSNHYATGIPDLNSVLDGLAPGYRPDGVSLPPSAPLKGQDVLFLPSIDDAGMANVGQLRWLLDVQPATPYREHDREYVYRLYPDRADEILSKKGASHYDIVRPWGDYTKSRSYVFPFFVVAHSSSGRIPAPLASGTVTWGGQLRVPNDTKVCPQCGEEVKAAALICRYCRYEFGPPPLPGQPGF